MTRVLLVDEDADQRETLRRGLFLAGIECVTVLDQADVLLIDVKKPAALIERARAARPRLRVLVITGLALSPEVLELRAGGIPILRKPFTADDLRRAIETLFQGGGM